MGKKGMSGTASLRDQPPDSFLHWHWNRISQTAVSMLKESVPGPRIERLVDFGCGDGWMIDRIAQGIGARRIVGLDLDAAMLKRAEAVGVGSVVADLRRSAPVRPGYFDLAFTYGVTEYIVDLPAFVEAMLRSVRPQGHVLLQYGLPGSMGDTWLASAQSEGEDVRMHVPSAGELSRVLGSVKCPFEIVRQAPIWHLYVEGAWRWRLSRFGTWIWDAADRTVRFTGCPPAGVFALLRRTA